MWLMLPLLLMGLSALIIHHLPLHECILCGQQLIDGHRRRGWRWRHWCVGWRRVRMGYPLTTSGGLVHLTVKVHSPMGSHHLETRIKKVSYGQNRRKVQYLLK
jgi:hypothetical protein